MRKTLLEFPIHAGRFDGFSLYVRRRVIRHEELGDFVKITSFVDTVENQVCGETSTYSQFALAAPGLGDSWTFSGTAVGGAVQVTVAGVFIKNAPGVSSRGR